MKLFPFFFLWKQLLLFTWILKSHAAVSSMKKKYSNIFLSSYRFDILKSEGVYYIHLFFTLFLRFYYSLYYCFLNVHYPIAAFDSYTLFFSFFLDFDDKKSWQNLSLSLSNISPSFSSSNNDRISSSKPLMFARSRSFSTFLHSLSLSSSLQHISPTSKDLFTFIYLLFFLSTQLECWVFFTMSLSLSLSIKPHTSVSIISTLIVKTDLSRRARTMFLISSLYKLICWQNVFFHPITPLLF